MLIVLLLITILCITFGVALHIYFDHKANEAAIEKAGKVCTWTHNNYKTGDNKLCIIGSSKCWIATLDMSLSGTLGDCDGDKITMSNLSGNIEGVDINPSQWEKTSEWDGTTLIFKKYAGDGHKTMWSSNNDGKGFGQYPVQSSILDNVTIESVGLSNDVPPKMSVEVSGIPFIKRINCTSTKPLTPC